MKFEEIYRNSKESVSKSLKSLWCTNIKNESQASYAEQLNNIIDSLFASEEFMPAVQCMDPYEPILESDLESANKCIDGLWTKEYLPYKHQYESWKALTDKTPDKKNKSIVVTTGTGSGKTECFMLPLVSDLKRQHENDDCENHQIEAIFLYPLNALIEDQKERLSELLDGTGLTFAVYNSSLPEDNDPNDDKIYFPGEICSRKEMRLTPPNILLTNPTMLEYMLLRQNDQALFSPGSLRWIVLDETHTYTGAGATELAMLLRRVMDAFQVSTANVRFATSSATIDNKTNPQEGSKKLKKFITSLCGLDESQVEHINGVRVCNNIESIPFSQSKELLYSKDYARLDEIVPGTNYTISERLRILDNWCDESIWGKNALRAKVHYFFRVPDNGLFVKLTEHKKGNFKIYEKLPLQKDETDQSPFLELVRCDSCGEYFAIAQQYDGCKYRMPEHSLEDLFDISSDDDAGISPETSVIFALTNKLSIDGKNTGNSFVTIKNNVVKTEKQRPNEDWVIVRNIRKKCPHCYTPLSRKSKIDDLSEENEEMEKFHTFRLSSDFISRLISNPILCQLKQHEGENPHNGQQYISFVDSRQAAAKSTLGQNLEEEMLWCYSRIFHKLCEQNDSLKEIKDKRRRMLRAEFSKEEVDKIYPYKDYFTWKEMLRLLKNDSQICQMMGMQFLNRSKGSEEIDDTTGELKSSTINLYLCSLLLEKLAKHPRQAASPETMGLFTSYYPKLDEKINNLPEAVVEFNKKLPEKNQIDLNDWKSLLQIYLDFRVRSDGSIMMKLDDEFSDLKLFSCRRFESTKSNRRPASKPLVDSKNGQYSNVVRLLAALYEEGLDTDVIKRHKDELSSIIDALWRDLTDTTGLLIDENQSKRDRSDYTPSFRLNVADIAFKLYDTYCLCDARDKYSQGLVPRPVALTFKGYSPYMIERRPCKPLTDIVECEVFPYYYGSQDVFDEEKLSIWKNLHRKLMCENIGEYNNKLWGIDGVFASRLNAIYSYPTIFVQAEHTAQIDKVIANKSQELFKSHKINILACSTTMEMGVDLGSLEFVLLSSVPPHPSNYRQRAGRSGRNNSTRSACATLCKSDSIGLRTLYNPLNQLINRVIASPTVDMNCRKVILRHVNSYLLRDFIFKYKHNSSNSNLELEIIDFFTRFEFFKKENRRGRYNKDYRYITHIDDNSRRIIPTNNMGSTEDYSRTDYSKFLDYLNNKLTDDLGVEIPLNIDGVERLLSGITCVTSKDAIENTIEQIKICYNELKDRFEYICNKYNPDVAKSRVKWNLEYNGLLAKNLLTYLSTNRFTPNANMPVDIVSFRQRPEESPIRGFNSDPSYQLVQALSMYSPGNTIIISNRTRVVRGIKYNEHKPKVFNDLYFDGEKATIQGEPENAKPWPINGQKALKVIQPVAFLPDVNESESRFINTNPYTQVEAQLVDPEDWEEEKTQHLYSIRRSKDKGNSKILYYNKGRGYGYCVCSYCGRTVLEHAPAKSNRANMAPFDMNNFEKKNGDRYHYNLSEKQSICCLENDQEDILYRNVILGAEIQTDYCEIRFKHSINGPWISKKERELLVTLGVVMTNKLIEYLDKERGSIDFLITPKGNLCIYDTCTGGSGYSTELIKSEVLIYVLKEMYELLVSSKSRDEILDKFSYKYINTIDIKSAIKWLEAEFALNKK